MIEVKYRNNDVKLAGWLKEADEILGSYNMPSAEDYDVYMKAYREAFELYGQDTANDTLLDYGCVLTPNLFESKISYKEALDKFATTIKKHFGNSSFYKNSGNANYVAKSYAMAQKMCENTGFCDITDIYAADMDVNILKQIFELADKYSKKVFAVVSNMSIAQERRDLLKKVSCFVCNAEEAGILFSEDYEKLEPEALKQILLEKVKLAEIKQMVVTIGDKGSIYVTDSGESGVVPSINVAVQDTAGAGDAFFAGVTIGLTYGKNLPESCNIGTRLATSVVSIKENVCPRFLPSEFNIEQ